MKKMIALFTAMAFALTLGTAFAEEKAATPPAPTAEKAPVKHKKHEKHKKHMKAKKESAAPEATAPAAK